MKNKPSHDQLKAITHIRGPALLVAGPGSGKTFTIVERILYLTQTAQISPDSILTVTFSKAAALEMKKRYLRENGSYDVRFGTFHSMAFQILRESFHFDSKSLITESEKAEILSQVFRNHGFGSILTGDLLSGVLDAISRDKNLRGTPGYSGIKSEHEELPTNNMLEMIADYRAFLKELRRIDFDDMILLCLEKLKENNTVLEKWQKTFRVILVDEFQDINEPQYELIKMLAEPENNLFAVGDDDQSIYGFRGSSPGIMQRFLEDFPDAKKMMLTENYRSGEKIVSFAGKVILDNKERFTKDFNPLRKDGKVFFSQFESRKEEEEALITALKRLPAEYLNDTAVILRTNREVRSYLSLLERKGLPANGSSARKATRSVSYILDDISAFLRFVFEGNHRSDFIRIMNKPNRYIRQAALMDETVRFDELRRYYEKNESMLKTLNDLEKMYLLAGRMNTCLAIRLFRNQLGYDRYLREQARDDAEYREFASVLQQIEGVAEKNKSISSVDVFIQSVGKALENAGGALSDEKIIPDGIRVITMHASKGLEFGAVFLPDINEGVIPPRRCEGRQIEEERRLLYVAATRARNELHIFWTNERGRDVSRFVKRIVDQ